MPTITATPDPSTAVVNVACTGGTPGDVVYVLRRDDSGVQIVRDSTEGLVWPGSDPLVVVDYEARQGQVTDYVLVDADGNELDSDVNVAIPAWGTWLKSPGLPYLNVKVALGMIGAPLYPKARQVVTVEGADFQVVLSQPRQASRGLLAAATLTPEQADAVRALLGNGLPIMIDAHPDWAIPYRYVDVGDVEEQRPTALDGSLGLTHPGRLFMLNDCVSVPPPVGPTQIDPGWTYDALATEYAAYATLPSSFADYAALAAGPPA